MKFGVALRSGQKTGFYLDQAENRQVVGKLGQGRKVLDLYCYTGGFGIHAAKAGAASVVSVDSSEPALAQAKRNAELNGVRQIEFIRADVDEYLKSDSKDFDLVIADPPRFATSQSSKEAALRKYFHINTEAMKKVRPGGFFVSCNCSGRVEASEWISLLAAAATKCGRTLQIIEQRGASRDHPVSAHCPETKYLKCVIGRLLSR